MLNNQKIIKTVETIATTNFACVFDWIDNLMNKEVAEVKDDDEYEELYKRETALKNLLEEMEAKSNDILDNDDRNDSIMRYCYLVLAESWIDCELQLIEEERAMYEAYEEE